VPVTQAFFVCQLGATTLIANKTRPSWSNNRHPASLGPREVVNHRLQNPSGSPQKPQLDLWHTGCNRHARREAIASHQQVEQTNLMKANTTRNLTSVVMLAITTPLLALAILVSIKTAGIRDNEILLVLFTLSSAVLSGINGFGRRAPTTVTQPSQVRSHLSARSSNNA
jgi:hypothetical protein